MEGNTIPLQKLIGQLDADAIENLKKGNASGIYAIELDGKIAYFKNPNRKHVEAATKFASVDKPFDYFESIATDTFLAGEKSIIEGDNLLHVAEVIKEKVTFNQAKLVNL